MPVQIRRYATLNRYHVSTMAYRAEKLTSTSDANGSLLDNTVILFGSNMGNSNQHQHFDVSHILVGGRNLGLQGNRHQSYERKTTTTGDLLLSIMDLSSASWTCTASTATSRARAPAALRSCCTTR